MSLMAAGLVIALVGRGRLPHDPGARCRTGTAGGDPAVARYGPDGGAPNRVIEGPHTLLCHPGPIAVGPRGEIFVLDQTDFSVIVPNTGPTWEQEVFVFDSAAQGDAAPVRTMVLGDESIGVISGMGLDRAGHMYILIRAGSRHAPLLGGTILVYDDTATGVPKPISVVSSGPGLHRPADIAVDSRGNLYVSDELEGKTGRILVFAFDPDGGSTLLRTIEGPETLLRRPGKLAIGTGDTLYVLNAFQQLWRCRANDPANTTVTVYSPSAHGDVEPVRSITVTQNGASPGRKYGYVSPRGLDVDADGNVYVWMTGTEALVFAAGSSGFVAPTKVVGVSGRTGTEPTGVTRVGGGQVYQAFVPGLGFCL